MSLVVEDAKHRFLKPNADFIPYKCLSKIAPCSPFHLSPLDKLGNQFLSIFGFCIRDTLSISEVDEYHAYNFPPHLLVANPQVFENTIFKEKAILKEEKELEFIVNTHCLFDGVAIYIELFVDCDTVINTLKQKTNWPVVYVKLFDTPLHLEPGERIEISTKRDVSTTDLYYAVSALVKRSNGEIVLSPTINFL